VGSPNISVPTVRATLAANVKACLDRLEWSESELSRRSGVSQKQVNNIVRERNGCSVEALHEIGVALRVPFWLLLMPDMGRTVPDGQTRGEWS
jgi:transcriptional regulator with XRE-family HTH domain